LAFAESGTGTEKAAEKESSGADFERSVLENLQAAGVQNGRRDERLEFDLVESHAGTHVQAIGTRDEPPDGAPARVGIALGPQYGTVSPRFIKDATLEAKDIGDLDLLCVLGFAFDPMAVGAVGDDLVTADESFEVAGERSLGGLPVLLVRMNTDLLMGEDLKKTGSGNLFTVFGEPDIDFSKADDGEHIVHLRGVDVYDPTTGELRSSGTDQVALWMIDMEEDFVIPGRVKDLVVRVQGGQHAEHKREDDARKAALAARGFLVLDVSGREVLETPDYVIGRIRDLLDQG
jgi:adenine-specific DNA-methyltransferase